MSAIPNNKITNFSKTTNVMDNVDLLEIQLASFREFLQLETTPDQRPDEGLYKVLQDFFPVSDTRNIFLLEFIDYYVDPPRYTIEECKERGLTYSVTLKVKLRLSCNDPEHVDFQTIVQDVFFGNIPYMTNRGSFVINGAERVIVSQLHRSPGVFFGQALHQNGQKIYLARVIPFKGTWIEFATDINNVMYAYFDRKKKFPVTSLLRALGYETDRDILNLFEMSDEVEASEEVLKQHIGRKLAERVLRVWQEDFTDDDTGEIVTIDRNEIVMERDTVLTEDNISLILEKELKTIYLQKEGIGNDYSIIYNTLNKDSANSESEALLSIYRQVRSTDAPDVETAKGLFEKMFFSDKKYDLGEVGRSKLNKKLGLDNETNKSKVLTKVDIISIFSYLVELTNDRKELDDIDHLSNRRVKTVGEQLAAQFALGLARTSRTIRDRMNVRDNEVFAPVDLVNSKAFTSVLQSFFGTSQLSQFLDQTNPISEITHKRRISALGPGGLSKERAGFEVRDVHYSHYGRLCTIETPEGPNIGLITTLCIHAKINKLGFIVTPYKKIDNTKVTDELVYLTADEEEKNVIAQANAQMGDDKKLISDSIQSRKLGEYIFSSKDNCQYIDVAHNQTVGLSASMIPFLEHDDANRALMGSNMQRQAVPLLRPEAPIVGTGMEVKAAKDSRVQIRVDYDGVVQYVDSNAIHVLHERTEEEKLLSFEEDLKVYKLTKFQKTNQSTCMNMKPCVKVNQRVKKGDFLTEGYSVKDGHLSLGRNLKVAFMPWKGYNFEDAIVISEKVVKEDYFTSFHIEEFEVDVRDTKLGEEELTPDIPNLNEDATKDLDENGIIRVGAKVKEGDILIGKIVPMGESDPTPEEKLLRAIFGDKAGNVRDTSLKAPASTDGEVIRTKLFRKLTKDKNSKKKDKDILATLEKDHVEKVHAIEDKLTEKLAIVLKDVVSAGVTNLFGEVIIPPEQKFTKRNLSQLEYNNIKTLNWTDDDDANRKINILFHHYYLKYNEELGKYKREKFNISIGDELPIGVLKLGKVYLGVKRKLKVGDKMAGRHGNKGIVAKIVAEEDMPFMEDGSPVDVVLNPLGVPSRMNIGQIYETVLGWVGLKTGKQFHTPIFDGADPEEIEKLMEENNLPKFGHTYLYDGETGDRFDQKATVGVIYMLKLHHMVDDKMHARSIGPYSLITQQPLGGKAKFGGQRLGEMEVWALEAYGASNILREMLTIKSDDMAGRNRTYEAIIKGKNIPTPGVPESFNVLVHELRGLGLDLTFEE